MATLKNGGGDYVYGDFSSEIRSYNEIKNQYDTYTLVLAVSVQYALEIEDELRRLGEKNKIVHMMCPFKVDDVLLKMDEDLFRNASLFEDDESRRVYCEYLRYKTTGNMFPMVKFVSGDSYFDKNILVCENNYRYIDVGCYTGDTIMQFLVFSNNEYESILGIEADPGNCDRARKFLEYARVPRATIENVGGWSEMCNLTFHTLKNNNDSNFDSPNFFRDASDIIGGKKVGAKEDVYEDVVVRCVALDDEYYSLKPNLIKVNALAADYNILVGAKRIIRDYAPSIVLDYGARPEFIKDTVVLLKELRPDYKLYLREKAIFGDYKTLLYARI